MSRLSTDKYVNQLQTEGTKNRLEDMSVFKEKFNESLYAGMEDLLKSNLEFTAMINADQREFEKGLAELDFQSALDIIKLNSKSSTDVAKINAIANVLSSGAEFGADKL